MSSELLPVITRGGPTHLGQFYGGSVDGVCLQLTHCDPFIQLTVSQAWDLAARLSEWALSRHPTLTDSPTPNPTEPKTLEQQVRDQLGAEGPQLPAADYEKRIDNILSSMTPAELLHTLSYTFDWSHLERS